MDLNIMDFIRENELVESPRVINHGFDLFEDLYLMKPFYVRDDFNEKGLLDNRNFNKNNKGSSSALYPCSIIPTKDDKVNIVIDKINMIDHILIGYKLKRLEIPENILSKYHFMFTTQPFLQYIMDDIVYNYLDKGVIGVLPKSYIETYPELDCRIKVITKITSAQEELMRLDTKLQLTYCEIYQYNNKLHRTLSLPKEVNQSIVDFYKAVNNTVLYRDNIPVKGKFNELFISSVLYGGETYDLSDLAAIKLNKISGLHWDPARDISSKIKVYNPAIGVPGTAFNVINSAYNNLLNTMRSNAFITSKIDILTILEESRKVVGPIFNIEDSHCNLNRLCTRYKDLSPIYINYRSYNKNMYILEEYIATNIALPDKINLAVGTDFYDSGISNITGKGISTDKVQQRGSEEEHTTSYISSNHALGNSKELNDGLLTDRKEIYKIYKPILENNLAGRFSSSEYNNGRGKSISKIRRGVVSTNVNNNPDYYEILDLPNINDHVVDYLNRSIITLSVVENDIFTEVSSIREYDLYSEHLETSIDNSNILLEDLGIMTGLNNNALIEEVYGDKSDLGIKIPKFPIVKIETILEDIDRIVSLKCVMTDNFEVFKVPTDKLNIKISPMVKKTEYDKYLPLKTNLYGLTGFNSLSNMDFIRKRLVGIYRESGPRGGIKGFGKMGASTGVDFKTLDIKSQNFGKSSNQEHLFTSNLKNSIATVFNYSNIMTSMGYSKKFDPLYNIRGMYAIKDANSISNIDYYNKLAVDKIPIKALPILVDKNNKLILIPSGSIYYGIDIPEICDYGSNTEVNTSNRRETTNNNIYMKRGEWLNV